MQRKIWLLLVSTFCFALTNIAVAQSGLAADLVSCWDLEEMSGTRYDAWGDNDLTDNNTVGSNTGHVAPTVADFEFDNSEYLSVADNNTFTHGTFTVAAWFYLESYLSSGIISQLPGTTDRRFSLLYKASSTNRIQLLVSSDGTSLITLNAHSFGTPSLDTWYLVIAEIDLEGDQLTLLVNDNYLNTTTYTDDIYDSGGDLNIGRHQNNNLRFDGRIGPVVYWRKVLSGNEKSQVWNGGNGLSCDDIMGSTGTEYAVDLITLPSGDTGAIEKKITAGDVSIASGLMVLIILTMFALMRDTVRSSKVADK